MGLTVTVTVVATCTVCGESEIKAMPGKQGIREASEQLLPQGWRQIKVGTYSTDYRTDTYWCPACVKAHDGAGKAALMARAAAAGNPEGAAE